MAKPWPTRIDFKVETDKQCGLRGLTVDAKGRAILANLIGFTVSRFEDYYAGLQSPNPATRRLIARCWGLSNEYIFV
jgi:hypothetical protein